MRILRIILLSILIIFVLIQFIRPARNLSSQTYPDDIASLYAVPPDVQVILKDACYDCHSNNTRYPWYVNIQPVGWMLARHVRNGKEELNFNEYGSYSPKRQLNKLKRMKEQIKEEQMPLKSYTLMHASARLTSSQKEAIIKWIDGILSSKETGK